MTPGEEALIEAMRLEQARIYGSICREYQQPESAAEPQLFARLADSYYGPAAAPVLAELVTAIAPLPRYSPPRAKIEQGIARGRDDEQIAAQLDVEVGYVAHVRADMDRASA